MAEDLSSKIFAADDVAGKHVLVVDDEALTHTSVVQAVRGAGLQVTCVADGVQALRVLGRRRVDLLVTTLATSVIDGFDLLRHIINRRLKLAVIVMTGNAAPLSPLRSPLRFLHENTRADALADAVQTLLCLDPASPALGLAEFVQILAVERRSCRLVAVRADARAQLVFASGVLVDATLDALQGDAAARIVLAWPHALLHVEPGCSPKTVTVHAPMRSLLPETAASDLDLPAWERPSAGVSIATLLDEAMRMDGALSVGVAVWESNHPLGTRTAPGIPADGRVDTALSGNCRVMRAVAAAHSRLGIQGAPRSLVISLEDCLHVLAPLHRWAGLFLYIEVDAKRSNIALAQVRLARLLASLDAEAAPTTRGAPGDRPSQ